MPFDTDNLLIYEYNSSRNAYLSTNLGSVDVNDGFNFSFVIDETKDSAKMTFWSTTRDIIKPYSIIHHTNTDTWWVVRSDNTQKYYGETPIWKHTISLEGAFELLNARDLTDIGFNSNRYTVDEFIQRLFKLSTFEFPIDIVYGDTNNTNINKDKKVDYVKTFENYTLASALREFLNGYNCVAKLSFTTASVINTYRRRLNRAVLTIIPKSGDLTKTALDSSYFDDVREMVSQNKSSYGEIVVSNANNVVSTKAKTFPLVGGVKLTGTAYTINQETAVVRLPTPAYKVNWLKMYYPSKTQINFVDNTDPLLPSAFSYTTTISPFGNNLRKIMEELLNSPSVPSSLHSYITNLFQDHDREIRETFSKATSSTLYGGVNYDATNNTFIPPKDNKDFYQVNIYRTNTYSGGIFLVDKELKSNLLYQWQGISWERGKDIIDGFDFLKEADTIPYTFIREQSSTDLRSDNFKLQYTNGPVSISFNFPPVNERPQLLIKDLYFQVNYIPMSDLKVKYDNEEVGNNIHLYNQTGKLTDSVAFSKLLSSYSKEIEGKTLTKFKSFNDYSEVPCVGTRVVIDEEQYVISNVSLDFAVNEYDINYYEYFINGEFTLSKAVATKSAMISPNSNIRDYAIPQNYNVKRKELIRDYYEFSHTASDLQTIYMPIDKIVSVRNYYQEKADHVVLVECVYDEPIGGANNNASDKWYYKLDTSTYILNKSYYEVVDFKDNNIIGYSSQNIYGGFDITKVLHPNVDINTPISYVDNLGQVKDINLIFSTMDELYDPFENYLHSEGEDEYDAYALINYPVFIPSEVYENVFNGNDYDFMYESEDYNKDATEVPFFEYCCQLGDSDDVDVGDNIFNVSDDDYIYIYQRHFVEKGKYNSLNAENYPENNFILSEQGYDINGVAIPNSGANPLDASSNEFTSQYSLKLTFELRNNRQVLRIAKYEGIYIDENYGEINYSNHLRMDSEGEDFSKIDLLINRIKIKKDAISLAGLPPISTKAIVVDEDSDISNISCSDYVNQYGAGVIVVPTPINAWTPIHYYQATLVSGVYTWVLVSAFDDTDLRRKIQAEYDMFMIIKNLDNATYDTNGDLLIQINNYNVK